MVATFCCIFVTLLFFWGKMRSLVFIGFSVSLVLAIIWFIHHMTSHLHLQF